MKKGLFSLVISLMLLVGMIPLFTLTAEAASNPTGMWVEHTETNGIPAQINVFVTQSSGTTSKTYTADLYLPGDVDLSSCHLSWDGDLSVSVDNTSYTSGNCPVPPLNTQKNYTFRNGTQTLTYKITTHQGSPNVQRVFIDVDESNGNPTIAQMDADRNHNVECKGRININGEWYGMPKMKGRGNATWTSSDDKKPYNVTLVSKINFPGVSSGATKKWSFLAEATDHSLLSNRSGYHLAYELGIGQDTTSADVWMNGEYQGCYTITPKTDSFVTKNGFMIEQDNYLEDSVANGGDPQFQLNGLNDASGNWSSKYNRITVKKMGDNLLTNDGVVDESPENLESVANNNIKPWLQEAWDAIRATDGKNPTTGKYYTEYIDIESFAKMYLMHEYAKSYDVCAGSILFHRDGMTDADKLIAGPMWDLDNAMGATCQNSSLGNADDRRNGDRRSGEGDFIANVNEYKTSIYKTLSRHDDFMEEVIHQYNKHRSYFDALPNDTAQMIDEIEASAMMNHIKVKDLKSNSTPDYINLHKYTSATTLGSGQYRQSYKATTNSKSDWPNYADNLITYITTRTLWFANNYYDPDDPANCEHTYEDVVTPPTCKEKGYTTHTCSKCGDSYVDSETPIIAHDYQLDEETGKYACSACGEKLINVDISCSEGASVTVYETQSTTGASVENATSANPRNSDTGLVDCGGDGQVNFVVNLQPGYVLKSVTAEPTTSYKNLKLPEDVGIINGYRITKVKADFTITVTAECTHGNIISVNAKEPTCEETGYNAHWKCDTCGVLFSDAEGETVISAESIVVPALGHTPAEAVEENRVEATCTEDGSYESVVYCSVCEKELSRETKTLQALGHDLENHEAKAATCTEKGWDAYKTCSRCDYTTYKEIPALGHKPAEAVVENRIEATCTDDGSYDSVVYCSVCEAELSREAKTIKALGHDLVDHEAKAATCTEKGWDAYKTCSRCDYTTYEEIAALGHTPAEAVEENRVEATCTEDGSYDNVVYCSVCEAELSRETKTLKALGHDLEDHEAKAATCTEKGWDAYKTCSRCDYTTYKEIAALGHTPAEAVEENRVEATCTEDGSYDSVVYCSVCEEELSREAKTIKALGHDLVDHEAKAATCTEHGWDAYKTCSRCDYTTYKEIAALGHKPAEAVEENRVEATCTKDGSYDSVVYCSVCEEELSREANTLEALGHDLVDHEAKAATCTEKGWDAYKTCSRCDYTTYKEIAALGHDLKDHEAKAATCTEHGWDAYKTCSRCDYTTYKAIPALGHKPAEAVEENRVDPTCTDEGSCDSVVYCSVCKAELSREEMTIEALGHDLEDHEAKAPTCTEHGWDAYKACSRCDYTTYKAIPALGHKPAEAVEENRVDPTCTDDGSCDSVVYCSVCKAELSREEKTLKALGHDLEDHEAKAPTCTEHGWDAYKACSRCDYTTYKEIAALGHDLTDHEAKAPTCMEHGWKAYQTCSRCDYTTYKELPALGHTPAEAVEENRVEETCTDDGSYDIVVYCSACKAELSRETKTLKALGHDLIDHEAKVNTCTESGWEAYQTCSRCDYTTYSETTELGHDLTDHEAKDPTCMEHGWEAYQTCSRCDYTTYKELPALGHTPAEAVEENRVEATCTDDGSYDIVVYCSACNAVLSREVKTLEALGHDYQEVAGSAVEPTYIEDGKEADQQCTRCGDLITGNTIPKKDAKEELDIAVTDAEKIDQSKYTEASYNSLRAAIRKAKALEADPNATAADLIAAAAEIEQAMKALKAKAPGSDPNQKGTDGTDVGPGASAASAEKAIETMKSDADPAGSVYSILKLRSPKQTSKSIKIKWDKSNKADKYVIYGNKCGKTTKPVKLATVKGKYVKTFKKVNGKKLKKGTYYKFIVVALDKDNNVVSTSKLIHVATKGGKVGNYKAVNVSKSSLRKAENLTVGKSLKLSAKGRAQSARLKVKVHRGLKYVSTDKNVATVTKKGVVKAIGKGTCYVYAYAQNGVFRRIKVTVK